LQPPNALKSVGFAATMQFFQAGELALLRCDDDLAAALVSNSVLLAEAVHQLASFDAVLSFQGTGLVVEAGMDDAAVMARLMRGIAIFGFQQDQPHGRSGVQEGMGSRKTNDAAPDYRNVVRHFAHGRTVDSTVKRGRSHSKVTDK